MIRCMSRLEEHRDGRNGGELDHSTRELMDAQRLTYPKHNPSHSWRRAERVHREHTIRTIGANFLHCPQSVSTNQALH
jgi:hypothetical protein